MNKRLMQIIAVAGVAVVVVGSGVWLSISSSPKFALYEMYHAAATNNTANFSKYYKVSSVKTSRTDVPPPPLTSFKRNYYQPLSFWQAMTDTAILREKITPDGAFVTINSQSPKILLQMNKTDGVWTAIAIAKSKQ